VVQFIVEAHQRTVVLQFNNAKALVAANVCSCRRGSTRSKFKKTLATRRRYWLKCLVCGLVISSKLEFGDLATSQMTFGENHQTPTCYG
jgi:hypothetical protein